MEIRALGLPLFVELDPPGTVGGRTAIYYPAVIPLPELRYTYVWFRTVPSRIHRKVRRK
jgi:hypothetical protein